MVSVNATSNASLDNNSHHSASHAGIDIDQVPHISMSTKCTNEPLKMSQDSGPQPPLIEDTIGDFFDAVVEKYPERESLVVCHQNIYRG